MRKMYEKGLKKEQGVAGRSQLNEIKLPYVVGQWLNHPLDPPTSSGL